MNGTSKIGPEADNLRLIKLGPRNIACQRQMTQRSDAPVYSNCVISEEEPQGAIK